MAHLQRAAIVAAFLIVAGMLIHNLNAQVLEPYFLGFEDKARDYADMNKIENALWSFSFTSSGITHLVVGFAMMILGVYLAALFRPATPVAAQLLQLASVLSGLGFLLTGISDIPGTVYGGLLRGVNPDYNTDILLMTTMFRGMVNILAIVGLGWFAGMVAWCAARTAGFSRGFRVFGWINALPGVLSLIFPPAGFAYIPLLPLWMLWLGLRIRALPTPDPA
jgi:hypothetical protein